MASGGTGLAVSAVSEGIGGGMAGSTSGGATAAGRLGGAGALMGSVTALTVREAVVCCMTGRALSGRPLPC